MRIPHQKQQLQDLAENHNNLRHIMQVLQDWQDEPFDWRRILSRAGPRPSPSFMNQISSD